MNDWLVNALRIVIWKELICIEEASFTRLKKSCEFFNGLNYCQDKEKRQPIDSDVCFG